MPKADPFDRAAVVLAALTTLAGISRIFLGETIDERIGTTTLTYFGVAGALLMLKKIKSLSFGETKVEMRDVEEKADQAIELAKTAESMARTMPQAPRAHDGQFQGLAEKTEIQPGKFPDDPWKGQFGGKAQANGRRLFAEVKALTHVDDLFLVYLAVESTGSKATAYRSSPIFHP